MADEREGTRFLEPQGHTLTATKNPKDAHVEVSSLPIVQGLLMGQRNLVSFGLFAASIYATLLSGLFLVVAIVQPRYGFTISGRGPFSPSSAALLTAFLAKTIELTFVMTFLAFLGQILSRRAVCQQGINLANLAMRSWILQPGTLVTQWSTVRVAGLSALGLLSLVATLISLLYTTAAGALVQPQLRLPPLERRVLVGNVQSDFANINSAKKACSTPIQTDREQGGASCMQMKWSSSCGYNFNNYMELWNDLSKSGKGSVQIRPTISATLEGNISVITAWLNPYDAKSDSEKANRIVNNITIAIPHRGVPAAARDPRNGLIQPTDLQNAGSYSVTARTVNPSLNALCVNANRTELAPIIYETWPNAIQTNKSLDSFSFWPILAFNDGSDTNNETVLDDVFDWQNLNSSVTLPEADHARPIFLKYPLPGNTIVNHTSFRWGRSMVYVLGKRPPSDDGAQTDDYFLCSLKTGVTTECSTRFNASSSGLSLEALCGSEYHYDGPISARDYTIIPNWRDIGFDLLNAMTLNTGVFDGGSSYARTLTQFQLLEQELSPSLPSPAEALLSMASCTALDLVKDFPFVPFWNYTSPSLSKPEVQYFNASVRVMQYMSGSDVPYQKAFIIILALTFAINVFILVYYGVILRVRLIADICEPLILFVTGYNSPPNHIYQGSLQNGLHSQDYAHPFVVERQNGQVIVVSKEEADVVELQGRSSPYLRLRSWRSKQERPK